MALAWVNIFDTGTVQLLDSAAATESAGVITASGDYSQGGVLCGPITGQRASVTLDAGAYTGRMRITIYEATYDSPYAVAVGFVTAPDGTIPLPVGEHIDSFPCIVSAGSVQIGFGVNYGNGGSGSASFKIEVEADVEEGLVANDDTALTTAATPVSVDVLANDTLEGSPVGINDLVAPPTVASAPANGIVVWNAATERFDYTPNAGFCGTDTFEYEIATTDPAPFIFTAGDGEVRAEFPPGSEIDWGDGSPREICADEALWHEYGEGVFTGSVKVEPAVTGQYSIGGGALLTVEEWGSELPLAFSVQGASRLTQVPPTEPPGVTNMDYMLSGAEIFNQDISGWDVSQVTSMNSMFATAYAFNQDISGWDTGNVTSMNSMFEVARAFNQPIGGWNVAQVLDMDYMLADADVFNQDLSSWCVVNLPTEPEGFALSTPAWTLPKPNWGDPC